MIDIDAKLLARLPLADIAKVTFYKRDEITTDLICCDFRDDWFAAVSHPPFSTSETVAYSR